MSENETPETPDVHDDVHDGAVDWARLREPFDPDDVEFRVQSTFERQGETSGVVVAYINARAVQDRLDEVVGPWNWAFDWSPLATANGAVTAAKGTLTICGVSKSDAGDAGQTEPTKASVSDALKRAAVMWGVGRYLYDLPLMYARVEKRGASTIIPDDEMKKLRAKLPRRTGNAPTKALPQSAPAPANPAPLVVEPLSAHEVGSDPDALKLASVGEQQALYQELRPFMRDRASAQAFFALALPYRRGDADADSAGAVDVRRLADGLTNLNVAEVKRLRAQIEHTINRRLVAPGGAR